MFNFSTRKQGRDAGRSPRSDTSPRTAVLRRIPMLGLAREVATGTAAILFRDSQLLFKIDHNLTFSRAADWGSPQSPKSRILVPVNYFVRRDKMTEPVLFPRALKIGLAGLTAGLLLSVQVNISAQQSNAVPAAPAPTSSQRQLLDRYCVSCHNERLKTGGLSLVQVDLAKPGAQPELWEKVVAQAAHGRHAASQHAAATRGRSPGNGDSGWKHRSMRRRPPQGRIPAAPKRCGT